MAGAAGIGGAGGAAAAFLGTRLIARVPLDDVVSRVAMERANRPRPIRSVSAGGTEPSRTAT